MSESKLQTQVQKELREAGWYVIRIIAAGKAGVADIVCCDLFGRFVTIEVKIGINKLSALQEYNADQVKKRNGAAYEVRTIEKVRFIISAHSVQELA